MLEHDFAQLRTRVAQLERQLTFVMRHLGITYVPEDPIGMDPEVVALVRRGDKLQAIRLHMQRTGANLLEAKELIDTIE
jgi:hypothetical protein